MREKKVKSLGSIMVVVPHEDDELLLAAGIIKEAVDNHQKVCVVMATNGDCGCRDYSIGRARLGETIEGLKMLGLTEEKVVVLGYADTGMSEEESFLMKLYYQEEDTIVKSHCSVRTYGLAEKPDFHTEYFGKPADYTRKNFCRDLKQVISEVEPDTILTTAEHDRHGDHKALFLFLAGILKELREQRGYNPRLYSGLVHSAAGDENWPERTEEIAALTCPVGLEKDSTYKWEDRISFQVPEVMKGKERNANLKYQAISKHKTALKPDAIDYLYSFVKADEIFWEIIW